MSTSGRSSIRIGTVVLIVILVAASSVAAYYFFSYVQTKNQYDSLINASSSILVVHGSVDILPSFGGAGYFPNASSSVSTTDVTFSFVGSFTASYPGYLLIRANYFGFNGSQPYVEVEMVTHNHGNVTSGINGTTVLSFYNPEPNSLYSADVKASLWDHIAIIPVIPSNISVWVGGTNNGEVSLNGTYYY